MNFCLEDRGMARLQASFWFRGLIINAEQGPSLRIWGVHCVP